MSRIYEIMYLLDNNAVRVGWKEAKVAATGLVEKHGGKVLTARRWEERKLAYPIKQRRRGTYLLSYAELEAGGIATLRRELDLTENVLRYLILLVEAVPPQEFELSKAESEPGFVVPVPPPEDVPEDESSARVEEDEAVDEIVVPASELAEEEV